MSEYWKSTPKYWCKHCKVFVRDTKLEKQNHDATPRHQGNLKRFLRDLHRGHEKEERDKERAKSEVSRLNGLVSGTGHGGGSSTSGFGRGPPPSIPKPQATPSQRKIQLAQLAEMGVGIPDEFRSEMAMAGEWQVTSERIIEPDEGKDKKPETIGIGVRKRTVPDDEEETEAISTKKGRWGSMYRTHPGDVDDDLDALFSKPIAKAKPTPADLAVKQESDQQSISNTMILPKIEDGERDEQKSSMKELSDEEIKLAAIPSLPSNVDIKQEDLSGAGEVVFKKRKAKNIRQK